MFIEFTACLSSLFSNLELTRFLLKPSCRLIWYVFWDLLVLIIISEASVTSPSVYFLDYAFGSTQPDHSLPVDIRGLLSSIRLGWGSRHLDGILSWIFARHSFGRCQNVPVSSGKSSPFEYFIRISYSECSAACRSILQDVRTDQWTVHYSHPGWTVHCPWPCFSGCGSPASPCESMMRMTFRWASFICVFS